MYCKYCYRMLEDGTEVCTACGKPLTEKTRKRDAVQRSRNSTGFLGKLKNFLSPNSSNSQVPEAIPATQPHIPEQVEKTDTFDAKDLAKSQYSDMPRKFKIDGVDYDLDNPHSIIRIPIFKNTFFVDGVEYGMDSILREHGLQAMWKNKSLYLATVQKVQEYREKGIIFESERDKQRGGAGNFASSVRQASEYLHEHNVPPSDVAEEYKKMREAEEKWLEDHYDFNSLSGILSIPVSRDLKRPPSDSVTGDVYYYLKSKAHQHEDAGNIDLAIACFRKSIALMRLKFGAGYGREESYSFVRMLARNGYISEAKREKAAADELYKDASASISQYPFSLRTDLVIMSVHSSTCPECAKYQGRVFSRSGSNPLFPKLPDSFTRTDCVHKGCTHSLHPYIHEVNDPDLEYTLSVHPLQNEAYGRDIVTFSNRPFEDDRTLECQQKAAAIREEYRLKAEKKKQNEETMIEREAEKGKTARDYKWLQENCPDKCPTTIASYRRMRKQNTKNFQVLKQFATEHGKEI